jgi:hypothetical protein
MFIVYTHSPVFSEVPVSDHAVVRPSPPSVVMLQRLLMTARGLKPATTKALAEYIAVEIFRY